MKRYGKALKRWLAMLLCVCMTVSGMQVSAPAAGDEAAPVSAENRSSVPKGAAADGSEQVAGTDIGWTGSDEQDTRIEAGSGQKLYNTTKGLHTDKSVTAREDGRTFDLKLESWYAQNNYTDVGMILDASGSMALISDSENLKPIKVTDTSIAENTYIPPEKLDEILDNTKTENSKLDYSNYSYYIYDKRDGTQEFVPLGYWDGEPVYTKKLQRKRSRARRSHIMILMTTPTANLRER